MNNLAFASIEQLKQHIASRQVCPDQLLAFFIDRFAQRDQKIRSALELFDRQSIVNNVQSQGQLVGIPGIIKDNICQQGRITSCASRMLRTYSATYDATAIARLKTAGAPLLGRANMDEFAMGSSTETSAYYKTANPWDVTRVPGGSSGGSAAAVAAGLVPWALGSDTGGSVRQPAAFCGIVGLKPTYGLVSRYGLIAYASSFDQIGVLTRTVADNAQILSVIAGHDGRDSTSLPVQATDYSQQITGSIKTGLVIGVIDNALNAQGIDGQVHTAIETAITQLQKLGATIKRISIPAMEYSAAIYWILSRAQAASNLARFDGVRYGYRDPDAQQLYALYANSRQHGFGAEVKRRILIGNYVLSVGHAEAYYGNAKKAQALMRQEFMEAFKTVDLLLAPTAPMPAFKMGAYDTNKVQMDLQDYYTCPMNVIGIPAISVPCGFSSDNLPIGLQLIGPHLSEQLLYQTAYAYEQATPWHTMHPQGY